MAKTVSRQSYALEPCFSTLTRLPAQATEPPPTPRCKHTGANRKEFRRLHPERYLYRNQRRSSLSFGGFPYIRMPVRKIFAAAHITIGTEPARRTMEARI